MVQWLILFLLLQTSTPRGLALRRANVLGPPLGPRFCPGQTYPPSLSTLIRAGGGGGGALEQFKSIISTTVKQPSFPFVAEGEAAVILFYFGGGLEIDRTKCPDTHRSSQFFRLKFFVLFLPCCPDRGGKEGDWGPAARSAHNGQKGRRLSRNGRRGNIRLRCTIGLAHPPPGTHAFATLALLGPGGPPRAWSSCMQLKLSFCDMVYLRPGVRVCVCGGGIRWWRCWLRW